MSREFARRLAQQAIERGSPLEWFEELYEAALKEGIDRIPWADSRPNPNLVEWLDRNGTTGCGRRALVVGCGLGDDAEELARRDFAVSAFDVSKSAIAIVARRFPNTSVKYLVGDLFSPPSAWQAAFAFVLEAYTLQVIPPAMRGNAARCLASFVAPGGQLLLIARARDEWERLGTIPWPVSRPELSILLECGLDEALFEDYVDGETPPVRRFRALYRSRQCRESAASGA
ncbi:MAG: methyltransferase domain-containing protein [Bryobacterales bacterium]|nr:methyltransferase domain-containing protein [Bryobacterales bacterium]